MVATGVLMPLQGWAWALDGILIGAGDFRYLAFGCTAAALSYIAVLIILIFLVAPELPNDIVRMAVLWIVLSIVLIGGRGLVNYLRSRGDTWMKNAVV